MPPHAGMKQTFLVPSVTFLTLLEILFVRYPISTYSPNSCPRCEGPKPLNFVSIHHLMSKKIRLGSEDRHTPHTTHTHTHHLLKRTQVLRDPYLYFGQKPAKVFCELSYRIELKQKISWPLSG